MHVSNETVKATWKLICNTCMEAISKSKFSTILKNDNPISFCTLKCISTSSLERVASYYEFQSFLSIRPSPFRPTHLPLTPLWRPSVAIQFCFFQGAYFAWKATAMGKNFVNGKTFLEKR